MKKLFLFVLLALLAAFTAMPVFAEQDPFKLDTAVKTSLPSVDKQIKKTKTTSCVGKWAYRTKEDKLEIECLSNGAMQIKHSSRGTKIIWRGVYTVSSNTILFHVHQTITKQGITKTTDFDDYFWPIAYKMTGPKQMNFYSTVEPNSYSKFRYTSERQFKKKIF